MTHIQHLLSLTLWYSLSHNAHNFCKLHSKCFTKVSGTGRAGLEGADEIVARLREEANLMRERAAEARSRLQSTHVSVLQAL